MVSSRKSLASWMLMVLFAFGWLLVPVWAAEVAVPAGAAVSGPVTVEGMALKVGGETFQIQPLAVEKGEYESALKVENPGWRLGVKLPGCAWRFRAMTPGSLKATLGDRALEAGKDYLLDENWASIGAVKDGAAANGEKVKFTYTYTSSRLDLLVKGADGKLTLLPGKPDSKTPLLPEIPAGATPILSVYLAHNTTALTPANVNVFDPQAPKFGPAMNVEKLKPAKDKAAGKSVTIAFLGDSITAQTDPVGGSFVDRFAAWLEKKYPGRKVVVTPKETVVTATGDELIVVKAGVGGDDTPRGLARLDKDVLAHKPDVVFIMFGVNDENRRGEGNVVPPADYAKNLVTLVERVRAGGGEPILMTTSMKNLGWSSCRGNLNEYAAAARQVAADKQVCLIDHFKAWECLPQQGYNYMIYLGSCINHPNELGHQMFFEGIRAAWEK